MKKILLLILAALFISTGSFAVESVVDDTKHTKDQISERPVQDLDQTKKEFVKKFKAKKKAYKQLIKNKVDKIKERKSIKQTMSNMLLVGALILVGGLLLYLIVSNAKWLGIAVMVVGLVLLLYGALKRFF